MIDLYMFFMGWLAFPYRSFMSTRCSLASSGSRQRIEVPHERHGWRISPILAAEDERTSRRKARCDRLVGTQTSCGDGSELALHMVGRRGRARDGGWPRADLLRSPAERLDGVPARRAVRRRPLRALAGASCLGTVVPRLQLLLHRAAAHLLGRRAARAPGAFRPARGGGPHLRHRRPRQGPGADRARARPARRGGERRPRRGRDRARPQHALGLDQP